MYTQEEKKAYEQGRKASLFGAWIDSNPYPVTDILCHAAWSEGWFDVIEDVEQNLEISEEIA